MSLPGSLVISTRYETAIMERRLQDCGLVARVEAGARLQHGGDVSGGFWV